MGRLALRPPNPTPPNPNPETPNPASALDRPRGQAGQDAALEDQRQHDQRHRHHHRRRHHPDRVHSQRVRCAVIQIVEPSSDPGQVADPIAIGVLEAPHVAPSWPSRYDPVVIPPFDPDTGNLPPGVHEATWDELVARYGYNPHRRALLAGLRAALDALRVAGCRRLYINGSFVTSKAEPADFDACWELEGVNIAVLDPILRALDHGRDAQKIKFCGELFPIVAGDPGRARFLELFQRDRDTGQSKGIVALNLETLP